MQSFQVAAFAFPVADGVIDKFQLGDIAEIANGKDGLKHRLQAGIVPLTRQLVHLQKAVIRTLLYLDQIGNLDRCRNLGKIESFAKYTVFVRHESSSAPSSGATGRARVQCGQSPRMLRGGVILIVPSIAPHSEARRNCDLALQRQIWPCNKKQNRPQGQKPPWTPSAALAVN
jgi:hypothetical protein